MTSNLFDKLFIFEMANNHMGDVEHGKKVIREIHEASKGFDFKFGFKLQYRNLDSFIHPDYKNRDDLKYIKRFNETKISEDDFLALVDEMRKCGFMTICTPFDEDSVDRIVKHDFDVIKIASCSFTDWSLLEKVAGTEKPVIASTAGTSLNDIDRVITFMEHRDKDFCVMQCVGEYPTENKNLQLNQIDLFKDRYPDLPIGYSTHESPDSYDSIKMAIAKGARVFEKHVGVPTDEYGINGYSATPTQVKQWLTSAAEAFEMCGISDERFAGTDKERSDLRGLQRGVFIKEGIKKGEMIDSSNSYLAIPNIEGQVVANDMSKYIEYVAKADMAKDAPVIFDSMEVKNLRGMVLDIIESVRQILIDSKVAIPDKIEMEISHHYGIEKFRECGATIINCINREYCKKLIIMLPGQSHPIHSHTKKEETFHVLYGDMSISLDGVEKACKAGDMVTVERDVKHSFASSSGAIFEEVSTTHYSDDSFYDDKDILANKNRKTHMTFWADWLKKPIR